MRLLLALATFMVINPVVVGLGTSIAPKPLSLRLIQDKDSSTRFLRAGSSATGEDGEERVISLSGVESFASRFKSTTKAQVEELLKSFKHTDDAFTFLKLGDVGDQLLTNSGFNVWAKFAAKLNKKNPEIAMVSTLRANVGDDELAKMLQKAVAAEETKNMAAKLQKAQFEQWYGGRIWPDDVVTGIFKLDDATWTSLAREDYRKAVRNAYSEYLTKTHRGWSQSHWMVGTDALVT